MEEEIKELFKKIDELISKKDYRSANKILSKLVSKARYDGVSIDIIREIEKRKILIYDNIFVPLPTIFSSIYIWILGLILSLFLFYFAIIYQISSEYLSLLFYLIGLALMLVVTHTLAHMALAKLYGIKISKVYLGGMVKLQPTVVAEYSSYFTVSPEKRKNYHAIGAYVTILTSLIILLISFIFYVHLSVKIISIIVFIGILITDIFFSSKYSDLKRARREIKIKEIKISK
jgi:hypothetical protein